MINFDIQFTFDLSDYWPIDYYPEGYRKGDSIKCAISKNDIDEYQRRTNDNYIIDLLELVLNENDEYDLTNNIIKGSNKNILFLIGGKTDISK